MSKVTEGQGLGTTIMSYEDLNVLRADTFDLSQYTNLMRAQSSDQKTFRNILPGEIKKGKKKRGCGKLPDPGCLSTYEFEAEITDNRMIDEVLDPCDAEQLDGLDDDYTSTTEEGWTLDEASELFKYVSTKCQETKVTVDKDSNYRTVIADMVLELQKLMFETFGFYAPKRNRFVVTVYPDVQASIKGLNLGCCDYQMVGRDELANDFKVKALAGLDYGVNPDGIEIMVYVPDLIFTRTMCELPLTRYTINQTGYKPNTLRYFASEDYGHSVFEYPNKEKTDTVAVVPGVKLSVKETPTP